ncbi:hypothetical protein BO78DRAFT_430350 [Aspergillus sclerotiicarbonarius CBS 121057]|uniref:Uncharacterized protein n=1 Tax=Aspergillus sclerotiicarbonarius (strain CBS 121057 / IBT 28362) TaxID=1448318 RepID=A0A319E686_ASPSB|nr:hypothetical protein BO78DRAFT_430350 [Aspergillus sclerotiicarbonarius CBS 121057]
MSHTEENAHTAREIVALLESRVQARGLNVMVKKHYVQWYFIAPRHSITKVEWIFPAPATEEEEKKKRSILSEWLENRFEDEPDRQCFQGFLQDAHLVKFFVKRRRAEGTAADEDSLEILPLDPEDPGKVEYNTKDENDRKIIEAWLVQQADGKLPDDIDLAAWKKANYEAMFKVNAFRQPGLED